MAFRSGAGCLGKPALEVIGVFIGVLVSFLCVFVALHLQGGDASSFVSLPAFTIVVGGSLGAALVSFRPSQLLASWRVWRKSQGLRRRAASFAPRLARYAGTVRHRGVLLLEKDLTNEPDPLVKYGLQQLVEGCTPDEVHVRLEHKLQGELQQMAVGERFFEAIGGYSPTFGIIGTVMALVAVLTDLGQPDKLAQGIATAFVATFYGVLLANVVALPLASRLREHAQEYLQFLDNLYLGMQLVHRGEAPLTLVERLGQSLAASGGGRRQQSEDASGNRTKKNSDGKSSRLASIRK